MLYLIAEMLFYLLVTAVLGALVGWLAKATLAARREHQRKEASQRRLRQSEARAGNLKNQLAEAALVEGRLRDELSRWAEGSAAAGSSGGAADELQAEVARRDKKIELLQLQVTQSGAALSSEWQSLNALKSELAERQQQLTERGKRLSDKLRGSEESAQQLRLQLRSMKRQEERLQQELAAAKHALAGGRENSAALIAQLKEQLEDKETMVALLSVDEEPAVAEDSPLPVEEPSHDDLQRIRGIGPVLHRKLNKIGVTSFRQIATWTDDDVQNVASRIGGSPGRIRKGGWVETARELMGGRSVQP